MKRIDTKLPGVCIIEPVVHGDARGYFMETYSTQAMAEIGIDNVFVQDNQSYSAQKGILRGIHFQNAPMAQAKLVRVTKGAVLDVAVDLRKGSPTYKQWVSVELSAENRRMFFIPRGFGHGFVTLTEDVSSATRSITSTAGSATAESASTIPPSAWIGAFPIPFSARRTRPRPCWRTATATSCTARFKERLS